MDAEREKEEEEEEIMLNEIKSFSFCLDRNYFIALKQTLKD